MMASAKKKNVWPKLDACATKERPMTAPESVVRYRLDREELS